MIFKSKPNRAVIKLSLLLYYALIVNAKDYEYCINPIPSICSGLDNIGISKYKISKVKENNFFLDPEAKIERELYPDFLALTMIQSKGLCSYGDSTLLITDIPEIRYGRSYQCYYAYQELQCDKEEKEKTSSKVRKRDLPTLCKKQCYEYYNSLVTYLNNNDYCPFQFPDEFVQPDDVYQQRIQYTDKMREICDNAEDTEDCFLVDTEKYNCGFINKELAASYCVENSDRDDCCNQFFRSHREIYVRNDPTIPLIFGVSVFLTFAIIGLFFSYQFIKDIKREERNRALKSVEKMFINSNSTSTSINSMDSGSQQSFQLSLATSDSNMTALTVVNGSCPNIPMIINDANNSNPALNSPIMNFYRMNRHNKNKSSSLVNFNLYAQPIFKSQSMGRNFRRKNNASSSNSNGNHDKHNKKKKVMTSSEAHQLYPRTSSNNEESNSTSSSSCLPYSVPDGKSSNNRNSGDSQSPMLDKKANKHKTSLPRLPYTSGLGSPIHTKTPQNQDIDAISYDITNVKSPKKINSISSYNTANTSNSNNTNDTNKESSINAENTSSELIEKRNEGRSKYTKRSASLHATSVKDLRFDSVKIQQMQQQILKQQQQLLQQQHQQKLLQQQQHQQLFYMPQPYTSQTPFSPQQLFNPQILSPQQSLPYQSMALPPMTGPQTVTPLPQQFSPQSFIPTQTVIPTKQMAPALPIRNKSIQSRSSSVKILHHQNSIPQMTRKYSLSALESKSSISKNSKEKMEPHQKSLDYLDNESSYTTLGSKMNVTNRLSDTSNITNINGLVNKQNLNNNLSSEVSIVDDEDETNSYFTEISSDVKTEDSMTTMIPTVVDSVPPSATDTVAPTLVETMVNSPQLSDAKKEMKNQTGEPITSILKNGNKLHGTELKEKSKTGVATQNIKKPVKKRSYVITNGDIESDEDEAMIKKDIEKEGEEKDIEKEGEEKEVKDEKSSVKIEPKKVTPSPERRKKIEKLQKQSSSKLDEYVFEAVKSFYPNEYSKDLKVLPGMTFKIMENININDFWVYVENIETGEKGNIPINCLAIKES